MIVTSNILVERATVLGVFLFKYQQVVWQKGENRTGLEPTTLHSTHQNHNYSATAVVTADSLNMAYYESNNNYCDEQYCIMLVYTHLYVYGPINV